jgi:elongation factor P
MDPTSFEQMEMSKELISDQLPYLSEGIEVQVLFWEEKALGVELPPKLTFAVADTGPGEKGNSAANIYKAATLENGLQVKVPLFIKTGEKVIIDTRSGEYVARA